MALLQLFVLLTCTRQGNGHGHMTYPNSTRHGGSLRAGGDCAASNGACYWFTNNQPIPGEPTLNAAWIRSVNVNVSDGPHDWSRKNPWRAPGTAPVFGSGCGVAGGGSVRYANGGNPPDGIEQGLDGLRLPPKTPVVWPRGSVQEVGIAISANHAGGYSWRLCKNDGNVSEECFQRTTLEFAGDKQYIVYSDGKWSEIPLVMTSEGTYPEGSQWARFPVPSCLECDPSDACGEIIPPEPGADYNTPWNQQVNCNAACAGSTSSKMGGVCPKATQFPEPIQGASGFAKSIWYWSVVDRMIIPSDLDPGEYLLSLRWDAEQSDQVFQNCADVTISVTEEGASPGIDFAPEKQIFNYEPVGSLNCDGLYEDCSKSDDKSGGDKKGDGYGSICLKYGVERCYEDKRCTVVSKSGKEYCWSDDSKMEACTLCPSRRDDEAMITENGKTFSCADAAKYLEEKESCEDEGANIRVWESICCPEAVEDECSLCPSSINRSAMITEGEDEKTYSCGDAEAYLKGEDGKNTCTDSPELMRSWAKLCCSNAKADYATLGTGACRGTSPTHNPGEWYETVSDFSGDLSDCEAQCSSSDQCVAIEFAVESSTHCELWKRSPQATSGDAQFMCKTKPKTSMRRRCPICGMGKKLIDNEIAGEDEEDTYTCREAEDWLNSEEGNCQDMGEVWSHCCESHSEGSMEGICGECFERVGGDCRRFRADCYSICVNSWEDEESTAALHEFIKGGCVKDDMDDMGGDRMYGDKGCMDTCLAKSDRMSEDNQANCVRFCRAKERFSGMSRDDVNHMFTAMEKSGDGCLSRTEFVDWIMDSQPVLMPEPEPEPELTPAPQQLQPKRKRKASASKSGKKSKTKSATKKSKTKR